MNLFIVLFLIVVLATTLFIFEYEGIGLFQFSVTVVLLGIVLILFLFLNFELLNAELINTYCHLYTNGTGDIITLFANSTDGSIEVVENFNNLARTQGAICSHT